MVAGLELLLCILQHNRPKCIDVDAEDIEQAVGKVQSNMCAGLELAVHPATPTSLVCCY